MQNGERVCTDCLLHVAHTKAGHMSDKVQFHVQNMPCHALPVLRELH